MAHLMVGKSVMKNTNADETNTVLCQRYSSLLWMIGIVMVIGVFHETKVEFILHSTN